LISTVALEIPSRNREEPVPRRTLVKGMEASRDVSNGAPARDPGTGDATDQALGAGDTQSHTPGTRPTWIEMLA